MADYSDKTREELIEALLKLEEANSLHIKADKTSRGEQDEKFRLLYINMAEGSALHTLIYDEHGLPEDYIIVEVNPAFEFQLGIKREAVINKTSREAYGVDTPPYFDLYCRVALTGIPEVFETYFAPLDKYFSISVYCPYNGSFATIFDNITERKKAENDLRIILAKYQVLFDIFPIGITITDPHGNIIESNNIAESLLGISREEQEKRKIDGQEWRIIRPDGSTMPATEYASVRALSEGSTVNNVEMGIVKGNNRITWLNVSSVPIPLEGYGVAIVYDDITERKKAEKEQEKTQKLLEDSQRIGKIGGWEFNIDTQEIIWTKEMFNIHEVESTFKPLVDERSNFYTPESLPLVDKAVRRAIEHGESYEIDSEIITAKGNLRSVRAIGKADLANRRVFGFFQDITNSKHAEKELQLKNEQLHELMATKDKFFSVIAHDLRSPFTGFLGLTQILAEQLESLTLVNLQKLSLDLNKSATNLFNLLNNLLEWARMQQGTATFEPKMLTLLPLVNTNIHSLQVLAMKKGLTIQIAIPDTMQVFADEDMLSSTIRNLVSNAVKFTLSGGTVRISAYAAAREVIEIRVEDNGIGMDEDTLENLFRPEVNTRRKGTEGEPSTGLGLLLCKEFIGKHSSKLGVESKVNMGSSFSFTLPMSPEVL